METTDQAKRQKKIAIILLGLAFTIMILGLLIGVVGGNTLNYTINKAQLELILLVITTLITLGLFLFLRKRYFFIFKFSNKSFRLGIVTIIYLVVGIYFGIRGTMCILERELGNQKIVCKEFFIKSKLSEIPYRSRTRVYSILCDSVGNSVRLTVDESFWEKINEGQKIKLYLKHGYWGHDYVTSYTIPSNQ